MPTTKRRVRPEKDKASDQSFVRMREESNEYAHYAMPSRKQPSRRNDAACCVDDLASAIKAFRGLVKSSGTTAERKRLERVFDAVEDSELGKLLGDALFVAMPYDEYRKTNHWEKVRKKAYRDAGYRCSVCNADEPLDAHHRTYENLGREKAGDVIALCRRCHELFHDLADES